MSVRVLAWFSCGDPSACAAKLIVDKYGDQAEVLYCDTFAYEHPDNRRYLADVERWIGREIKVLKSDEYADIYDVFERTRWLVGVQGARCTTELKKNVRKAYQKVDDIHVFGYRADEVHRVHQFWAENPELFAQFPLVDAGLGEAACHAMVRAAGIEEPAMYKLGYRNNNCIGCVKGQAGYWNKIRVDFPVAFDRMAKMERKLDAAICKKEGSVNGKRWRKRVFLDELDPKQGRYAVEPDIECGVLCVSAASATSKDAAQ